MRFLRVACLVLLLSPAPALARNRAREQAAPQSASDIVAALRQMTLDPARTYHVRDLQLSRGDIKIYLTEGVLSFAAPVAGRTVAAVFTTEGAEAGDAEVLVLPPQRSERASLASFTKTPNLDEHFASALFLFSDDTAREVMEQIAARPIRKAPEIVTEIAPVLNPLMRAVSSEIGVRLVQAALDNHSPAQGFFYGLIAGRDIGTFEVMYEPTDFEPVSVGRIVLDEHQQKFQLWTEFRPRRAPPFLRPTAGLSDYRVDAEIHPDLSMTVKAAFKAVAGPAEGRVLAFGLSEKLKVLSASMDGNPVEVFQGDSVRLAEMKSEGTFLLVSGSPLTPNHEYQVEIRYQGSVIRQTGDGSYFVDERNAWYPFRNPMRATFDLTFRCPARLRLVSTGDLIGDEVHDGIRTVHRVSRVPEALAGFNLGDYDLSAEEHGLYRVECYGNKASIVLLNTPDEGLEDISKDTERILDYYTHRWIPLPIRSIAVSPIPGYFGQGFPGLIYLSTVSYIRQEDRPARLRNPRLDSFFSDLLLPHEVAHQWWGNIVNSADYRTSWLMEAMANYSALQFLDKTQGSAAVDAALTRFRDDLTREVNGKTVESSGPVDFGARLLESGNMHVWHDIIYEKGAWILQMLDRRLGDDNFNKMQMRMLAEYASKPIANEDFRRIAGEFVPPGQPDKTLSLFFDTWVYGTGIPKMRLRNAGKDGNLNLSGVDNDFTADVPLQCKSKDGKETVRWVRASEGDNSLDATGCELPPASAFLYSP